MSCEIPVPYVIAISCRDETEKGPFMSGRMAMEVFLTPVPPTDMYPVFTPSLLELLVLQACLVSLMKSALQSWLLPM